MKPPGYYIINGITFWRILMAPLLLFLALNRHINMFKWLLALCFLTDAADGYLARRYNVSSERGAILDSIGDDLTVGVAIIGMFVFKMNFIRQELLLLLIMISLYAMQLFLALVRYHKLTSFHTRIAKAAAILQGVFLLLLFFLPSPVYIVFYAMACMTILDLVEEIVIVLILHQWEANVKGLYWVIKRKRKSIE